MLMLPCPNCRKLYTCESVESEGVTLLEGATFKCPDCGAEFEISATPISAGPEVDSSPKPSGPSDDDMFDRDIEDLEKDMDEEEPEDEDEEEEDKKKKESIDSAYRDYLEGKDVDEVVESLFAN